MASKSARRRARQRAAFSVPYGRMRPLANWQVVTQALTTAGQIVGGAAAPTSVPCWNPTVGVSVSSGGTVTWQVACIMPGVQGGVGTTPQIGRQKIDRVKGRIHVLNTTYGVTLPNYFVICLGIYVSEYTVTTTAWDVYDPSQPADAARDDYWLLDAMVIETPATAGSQSNTRQIPHFDIDLAESIIIGNGQAVNVTASVYGQGNAGSCILLPSLRAMVGPVA